MGEYLNKDDILIKRDGEGKLLGIDVNIEFLKDKPLVQIVPMTKGQMNKYDKLFKTSTEEAESEIIHNHCVRPAFTLAEAKQIRYDEGYATALIIAIIAVSSGSTQDDIMKSFLVKKKDKSEKPTGAEIAKDFQQTKEN